MSTVETSARRVFPQPAVEADLVTAPPSGSPVSGLVWGAAETQRPAPATRAEALAAVLYEARIGGDNGVGQATESRGIWRTLADRILAGVLPVDAGAIFVARYEMTEPPPRVPYADLWQALAGNSHPRSMASRFEAVAAAARAFLTEHADATGGAR